MDEENYFNIFFIKKEVTKNGTGRYYPLPNQSINKLYGKELTDKSHIIDVDIEVILRFEDTYKDGTILGTNDIKYKASQGIYVSGGILYPVFYEETKETIVAVDDLHTKYINAYNKYTSEDFSKKTPVYVREYEKKSFLSLLKEETKLKVPTIEEDGFYVDYDIWYFLLRNVSKREKILIVGESGVGKTELIALLAKKLNKELEVFDMAISNPMVALCGSHRMINGESVFQYARFAKKLSYAGINNDGIIINLDELSRAHPTANNILMPVLDSRRTLYIENAMEDVEIKLNPDNVIWATANIGMEYIGTSTLDHALMNRFIPVEIDFPPPDKEINLLVRRTNISKEEATVLIDFATNIRNNNVLSKKISTRQLLKIGDCVYDGYSKPEAIKFVILNQYEKNSLDGGERAVIYSIIQSL
jgi:nitric oxide reductase NorQ protein